MKKTIQEKELFIYYGVSGGGKTYKVYEENDINEIYEPTYGNSGIWFDGYNPE